MTRQLAVRFVNLPAPAYVAQVLAEDIVKFIREGEAQHGRRQNDLHLPDVRAAGNHHLLAMSPGRRLLPGQLRQRAQHEPGRSDTPGLLRPE
jgi:hypothetical protein